MKFSIFVLGILLALTGTADAKPARDVRGRVTLNENKLRHSAPRHLDGWIELTSATPASDGTVFVMVDNKTAQFSQLRVEAVQGRVLVRKLKIFFDDGSVQLAMLGSRLDRDRKRCAFVDLDEVKPINRIVITTDPTTDGFYTLYGTATPGVASR